MSRFWLLVALLCTFLPGGLVAEVELSPLTFLLLTVAAGTVFLSARAGQQRRFPALALSLAGLLLATLLLPLVAQAQDLDPALVPTLAGRTGASLSVNDLLILGPYGGLLWGAWVIGRGFKVTVQVELSEQDRGMIRSLGDALEKVASR